MKYIGLDVLGADELPSGWMTPDWGTPSLVAPTSSDLPIKKGSKGNAVKWVQGKVGAPVDGDFGPATLTAVKNYQDAHGLKSDGVVGQATLTAMLADVSPSIEAQAAAIKQQMVEQTYAPKGGGSSSTATVAKKTAAAAAGGVSTCGAVSHSWQSSVAMIVFLILLILFVHLLVFAVDRLREKRDRRATLSATQTMENSQCA